MKSFFGTPKIREIAAITHKKKLISKLKLLFVIFITFLWNAFHATTTTISHRWARGVSRGVDPHLFQFFMTPPPLKFKSTPPPREGLLDPLAGFWIFVWRRFFLEIFFENFTSQKNFAGSRRPNFFSRKSPNHAILA